MMLDLHVHTKYSVDASNEPKDLVWVAKARGLDGIAVTDHDTISGWEHFSEAEGFTVIRGIERTTDHGSVIGLFLNEEIEAKDIWEAIDEIRSQDGVVVLPHPCDALRKDTPQIDALDDKLLRARIDAVEVFNSRCVLSRFNKEAERLAADLNKHRVGGSDAHTMREVGNTRTRFTCDSPEEIRAQLKMGTPLDTVVEGRLSSRLIHLYSFLNKLQK